jgi:hypothetical protein
MLPYCALLHYTPIPYILLVQFEYLVWTCLILLL